MLALNAVSFSGSYQFTVAWRDRFGWVTAPPNELDIEPMLTGARSMPVLGLFTNGSLLSRVMGLAAGPSLRCG